MSVFSNINKVAKNFYNNTFTFGDKKLTLGKSLKANGDTLDIDAITTLSFWNSEISYDKGSKVLVCIEDDGNKLFKIYEATKSVKSTIAPNEDSENWEECEVQISDFSSELLEYYGTTDIEISPISDFTFSGDTLTGYNGTAETVVIPYKVNGTLITQIGNNVFLNCNSLINVIIPNSVSIISNSVFRNCENILSITLPKGLTTLGASIFYNCSNLTDIVIPNDVTGIGNQLFKNCTSLKSIVIPNKISRISSGAFDGCNNLNHITIRNNITAIGSYAFRDISESAVFYVEQGSYGEEWCKENEYTYKYTEISSDIVELSQKSITHNSDKKIRLYYGGGTLYNIDVDGMYIYPELAERCHKAFCDVNGDNITETYATKKELENYVKKDDYSGINSMNYFYADNFNNGLFGKVATSGAVLCDYIFKNNSMADITVDLSSCYSMIGGFMGSSVETVTFENGTPKLQKANNLFRGCAKMVSVTGLDLTNCDSVKYMFMDCESLTQELTVKTKATDLSYMFMNCKKITSVTLDTPNLKIAKGIFTGCESLNKIIINTPLDYTALFNELPTVENKVIELVNQNLAVTAEVEKIATSKGWSIKYISTVNKDFATIY